MDTTKIIKDIAELQKSAANLQIRLLAWTVVTADDRNSVREDIEKLDWNMQQLLEEAGITRRVVD